jgi:hypothetical protein
MRRPKERLGLIRGKKPQAPAGNLFRRRKAGADRICPSLVQRAKYSPGADVYRFASDRGRDATMAASVLFVAIASAVGHSGITRGQPRQLPQNPRGDRLIVAIAWIHATRGLGQCSSPGLHDLDHKRDITLAIRAAIADLIEDTNRSNPHEANSMRTKASVASAAEPGFASQS